MKPKIPLDQKKLLSELKNLPNKLTLLRILIIPFILILYPINYYPFKFIATLLFIGAAVTDIFDGYLARKYESVTVVGALIDPIADKMLVVSGLFVLVAENYLWAWLAATLVCRDMLVSGMRLVMLEQYGKTIEVHFTGKLKTIAILIALPCLMVHRPLWGIAFHNIGMITIWIGLILSVYSAYLYANEFSRLIKNQD